MGWDKLSGTVRSKTCLLNNQKSKQVLKCCRLSRTTGLQLMCSTTKKVDVLILNQQKSSKSCSTTKKTFPSSFLTVLLAPRLGFEDPAAALQNSQTLLPGLLLVRFSTADMTTHGRSTIIYAEILFWNLENVYYWILFFWNVNNCHCKNTFIITHLG